MQHRVYHSGLVCSIICYGVGMHVLVGLFVKENINYKVRDDLCRTTFIPHESVFIEIVSTYSKNTIVEIIYRPNMGDANINLLKYRIH